MKSQQGKSDGTKSSIYVMLNGSKFFLFHLDLLKTQSSNGFSFELTIRFYRQILSYKKTKLKDTHIFTFCRGETETIEHILWDWEIVKALLDYFVTFCSNKIHRHFSFPKKHWYLDLVRKKTQSKIILPCK